MSIYTKLMVVIFYVGTCAIAFKDVDGAMIYTMGVVLGFLMCRSAAGDEQKIMDEARGTVRGRVELK